jgi:Tol biopolymer transport system component
MRMRPLRLIAVAAAIGMLAAIVATSATATFAGANGRIAFTMRTSTGEFDVYTMRPNGTGVVQVTKDPARDFSPRWSPAGNDLVFSGAASITDRFFEIYLMHADGS